MKSRLKIFTMAILFTTGAWSLFAAPPSTPVAAKLELPKSVFVMPTSAKEGRAPFFPNSQRPYFSAPSKNVSVTSLTELTVKSILPSGNRVFAIINNHTFAPGDDGVVSTRDGRRLTIHCVDINAQAGTVTVESSGARAVLHFSGNP